MILVQAPGAHLMNCTIFRGWGWTIFHSLSISHMDFRVSKRYKYFVSSDTFHFLSCSYVIFCAIFISLARTVLGEKTEWDSIVSRIPLKRVYSGTEVWRSAKSPENLREDSFSLCPFLFTRLKPERRRKKMVEVKKIIIYAFTLRETRKRVQCSRPLWHFLHTGFDLRGPLCVEINVYERGECMRVFT